MRKISIKLIAITLTLILSLSVMVMSTYAWFVLSKNPVVTGTQVAIGGGNTILIAPDITQVIDGKTYHYPGAFSDTMHFEQQESYSFLKDLGGLTPVSTADGVNWFLPDYYDFSDDEVRQGMVYSGQIKDVKDFYLDSELEYANLTADQKEKIGEGSYICLDFWVVSHGGDYNLRISTGEDTGGSFVLDMMEPVASNGITGYSLETSENQAAGAVRVGFLANNLNTGNEPLLLYQDSTYFDSRYTSLRGFYQEPDSGSVNLPENRFTIYEPNCDVHPGGMAAEGSYAVTSPLGLVGDVITPVSVAGQVTAQKASTWTAAENGAGTALAQRFQTAMTGKDLSRMDSKEIKNYFYSTYLQGQFSPYVNKGNFIKKSTDLYKFGESITAEQLAALDTAGATNDVQIIQLERYVPQRIRMFIWLEGQDVDCVNTASASSFALSIELAGGSE